MVIYLEGLLPINQITLSTCGHVSLRDKLETLYLHYHNVFGHQTYQGGGITQRALTHKATWLFDHVNNMRSRENIWKISISTFTILIATKRGRALTSGRKHANAQVVSDFVLQWIQCYIYRGSSNLLAFIKKKNDKNLEIEIFKHLTKLVVS